MKTKDFVGALDHQRITGAITEAEKRTSGQLRVFICHKPVTDALPAARERFKELGMEKTIERNGILIFFAPEARRYAVVGDQGIHERCGGDEFWRTVVDKTMRPLLKSGHFTEAIVQAIAEIGRELAVHFPPRTDGTASNELPDAVEED
jgi:uncharacterized membrane protein